MDAREQFGREAEKYLTSKTHANSDELARLVSLVPAGGSVLDIATGAGHVAFAFAPSSTKVVANDITPEMLAIVKRQAGELGLSNIETAIAQAEELPFEDGAFDGVTCRLAPHHFASPMSFLTECWRVLKPGGWFLLVDTIGIENDPVADDALNQFEALRDPSHVRDYTVSQWRNWIEEAGFTIQHVEANSFYHELETWMDRMSVSEPARTTLREAVQNSGGALRDYFAPKDGSFRLHQVTIVALKAE